MLADKKISGHTGIQMRQDKTGCNLHVSVDANSGQNGQPVTGTYHKDIFSPNPNSNPADAVITLPFHAAEAALDKQRTRDKIPGTIAKIVTETDGSKTVYVWDQHGQPIRQDLFHG